MEIEYEATFANINKSKVREKLKIAGAVLERSEFIQKRVVFDLPNYNDKGRKWLRVRDEGNKVTLSLKEIKGNKIMDQKETCLIINNFNEAVSLLENIGCPKKAYQETKRELWKLDDVEITIDEWPFLEPFVEVEGQSEEEVKKVCQKIGFDWSEAKFCTVDTLYQEKYLIPGEKVNKEIPLLVFDMQNPFL